MLLYMFQFLLNLAIAGGGIIALVGYYFNRRNKIRYNAFELKTQIIEIENQIKDLNTDKTDLTNFKFYKIGPIISSNYWNLHKAEISRYLSYEDKQLINDFYSTAEKIEQCRFDLINCLRKTWEAKCFLETEFILQNANLCHDDNLKTQVLNFDKNPQVFTPDVCISLIIENRNSCKLTGTTTFEKIDKLCNYHCCILKNIF